MLLMKQQKTFDGIFQNKTVLLFSSLTLLTLMILPFFTTFNEFLTSLALKSSFYRTIQDVLVPTEAKMVSFLLQLTGMEVRVQAFAISFLKDNVWQTFTISWNCIGWQSAVLLIITLLTGLQGPYTVRSKFETILFGVLGTALVNILRITVIFLLAYYLNRGVAQYFHDIGATIVFILWMFLFWYIAYAYVLEVNEADSRV